MQKILHFFICIFLNYVAHEITKEFWKNSHFENMTADFYAAGLLPVVRQFGREFFRVSWLLFDKNLNFLETSRYKTFLSRLPGNFYLLTSYQKIYLQAMGLEPTTSRSIAKRSTSWAIEALLSSYENLEFYILHTMVCLQKRKSSAVHCWWKVYIRTVNFSCMFLKALVVKNSVFSFAGLLQVGCQFSSQFCRFAEKIFLSRLAFVR